MIAAVVLAAGASSRMGVAKQTLDLEGVPMLERVLATFRRSKVGRVVVVIGAHADDVRRCVGFADEVIVENKKYAKGMSGSLRIGLKKVGEAEAAFIALGDQPYVRPETVDRMMAAYERTRARIVIPTYRGTRGNPVLFDRSVFPQIERVRGDVGARSVVHRNAAQVLEVEVSDLGVLVDLDTPSDMARRAGFRKRRTLKRA
ncbi:MAG TPA: nucleotidyltransferase family protein [Nitrososphaerales archaeon]|nr:nucleotidyltransferase family protein [Nitrososphaerales archaeon]